MTQANVLQYFMPKVWDSVPGEDLYDKYSDARVVATILAATTTATKRDEWEEWLFPDGSLIWINDTGSGITEDPSDEEPSNV